MNDNRYMVIIMNEDKVQCQICKKWFKQITGKHLENKHGITFEKYKEMFPDAETCPQWVRDKISNNQCIPTKIVKLDYKKPEILIRNNEYIKKSDSNIKLIFKQMDLYMDLFYGKLIQCKICGSVMEQLSKHLVYKHGISVEEYKKLYPNVLTIAPSVSKVMIDANIKKWQDDDYKKNIADQNRISTIKQLAENPTFFNTKIELKMQNILTKYGYEYVMHQSCCDVCLPDIMFPDKKIAVFCDGDYWHNLPNYIERDKYQDRVLLKNDWIPLRFWEHEINDNIEDCLYRFELEYWGSENIIQLPTNNKQLYKQNVLSDYY